MNNIRKIDLHMHSTVSDGTDTPEELLEQVRNAGIELFALTDHDTAEGCVRIRKVLHADDPLLLSGIEFSCRDEEGKYHILGYGFDPDSPSVRQIVTSGHRYRMEKVIARLDFLRTTFGFVFPEHEIQRLLSLCNPGKPHIGNLMVQYGYASSKDEAINRYINQIRFHDEYVRPDEAVSGILGGGGIPVLAHPAFGSGDELIIGDELEQRIRRLIGYGLRGLEVFYSGYTPKLRAEALKIAEKHNLLVTAGSDYHGKNKLVTLGDTALDQAQTIPDGMLRFLEEAGDKCAAAK